MGLDKDTPNSHTRHTAIITDCKSIGTTLPRVGNLRHR